MSIFSIAGIALIVGLLMGGGGTWKATSLYYKNEIAVAAAQAAADVATANQRAENAASDWEVWASLQRPKTITITREVEREIAADDSCSRTVLPPGLRDSLTRAGADPDRPVAAVPLLGASAADAGHFWGRAARLFGTAGGTPGVPAEAPGAR